MKLSLVVLAFLLLACGGSLSDEQRKQMREKMELNKIVHVTEAEITEAAFEEGRKIVATLDSLSADSARLSAYLETHKKRIHYLTPQASNARALERQLIEAYLADASGAAEDNVQEKRNSLGEYDSLLYTKPVTRKLSDGSESLEGIWNIWFSKKELVIQIGKTKE